MNQIKACLVFLAIAACTSGCGGDSREPALRIAMIAKNAGNPVFTAAKRGALTRAREIEAETGVGIDVEWRTPEQEDGRLQAEQVQRAAERGADAVLISCVDAGEVTPAIDAAAAMGTQVMTFDSDAAGSARFSYVGLDNQAAGVRLMQELAAVLNGRGKVAVLAGNPDAPNLQARVQGLLAAAGDFPNIEIIGVFHHEETAAAAASRVLEVTAQHPDLQGWAMIGGWPLFSDSLLQALDPSRIKIVSMDALPQQLEYVNAGLAPVLLAQPMYDWGYLSVQTIFEKVYLGEEVPSFIPLELVRVSKENLGSWARTLQSWGFTDVPEKFLKMP